jgi:flagellar basal-body rod modification protein FlgD
MGNRVPADVYRLSATAVVNGKTSSVPVNTLSTVRAVSTAPDGAISLQVEGGQIVPLKDITRIDM